MDTDSEGKRMPIATAKSQWALGSLNGFSCSTVIKKYLSLGHILKSTGTTPPAEFRLFQCNHPRSLKNLFFSVGKTLKSNGSWALETSADQKSAKIGSPPIVFFGSICCKCKNNLKLRSNLVFQNTVKGNLI